MAGEKVRRLIYSYTGAAYRRMIERRTCLYIDQTVKYDNCNTVPSFSILNSCRHYRRRSYKMRDLH